MERGTAKGDPRLSCVFARLFITVYYFLLSMESRIVGGRGGPRRISKTVSDRICIYRAGTRVRRPITGPINRGSALFSVDIKFSPSFDSPQVAHLSKDFDTVKSI